MSNPNDWVQKRTNEVVKKAKEYHGGAWHFMSPKQKLDACAPEIVRLMLAQDNESVAIMSFNQIAREIEARYSEEG